MAPALPPIPDCRTCGACCTTGAADTSGKVAYLPITKAEARRLPADVTTRATLAGFGKVRSLRFEGDRCAALAGVVGLDCSCSVYDARPKICRVFPPGHELCLASREERGIR